MDILGRASIEVSPSPIIRFKTQEGYFISILPIWVNVTLEFNRYQGVAVGGTSVGGIAVVGISVGGTAVVGTAVGGTAVVGTAVAGTGVRVGVAVLAGVGVRV